MNNMTGIIYKYTSPSGKSYIGQTTNEEDRKNHWFSNSPEYAGSKINKARAKYGAENFTYDILFKEDFDDDQIASTTLDKWEKYYIDKYDTFNNGYNLTIGGLGVRGYKWTEESKRKLSELRKGKPLSEEHKKNISISNTGKVNSKPIEQFTKDNEFINEYISTTAASKITGISRTSIKNNVCGYSKSAGGYIWKFKEYGISKETRETEK